MGQSTKDRLLCNSDKCPPPGTSVSCLQMAPGDSKALWQHHVLIQAPQHCFYETSLTNVIQYVSFAMSRGQRALSRAVSPPHLQNAVAHSSAFASAYRVPCTCQLPPCGPLRPLTTAGLLPGRLLHDEQFAS